MLHDLLYVDATGGHHNAREGLVYDGGSKPVWTWWLLGHPWNEYLSAYTIHDQNCIDIRLFLDSGVVGVAEARRMRLLADRIFLEGMRWIKRHMLDRAGSRIERMKVRVKYPAVRLHAWKTIR